MIELYIKKLEKEFRNELISLQLQGLVTVNAQLHSVSILTLKILLFIILYCIVFLLYCFIFERQQLFRTNNKEMLSGQNTIKHLIKNAHLILYIWSVLK